MQMKLKDLPPLKNIIDSLNISENLDVQESIDIIESSCNLFDYYVNNNILGFSAPNFHEELYDCVLTNIINQLPNSISNTISNDIENLVHESENIYFKTVIPQRSFPKTFIRIKSPDYDLMETKIQRLIDIPQPDQRTDEWYHFRHNLLTASSAWKCLYSESARNQIIYEKCQSLNVGKFRSSNITTPFHWGQKYEPVSVMLYEKKYNTKVDDFGCIQHQKYKFLGASPDGINTKKNNLLYGRMLEIKNIFNREINGIPKQEYWIQMQLQMETCELNECDFLETRFKEYETDDEFYADGTFTRTKDNKLKGIIMHFNKEGYAHYEYCPLFDESDQEKCKKQFEKWEDEMMDKNSNLMWVSNVYWYLDQKSCVLVLRNKKWFQEAVVKLEDTWRTIERERITGCEHRAPRQRKNSDPNKIKQQMTEKDKQERKIISEKIKTSPQLSAITSETKNNPDSNVVPIIKVLTEELDETEFSL